MEALKNKRQITQRAIMFVGYQCNAHCVFCYDRFRENKIWRDIDELKREANRYRYVYRLGFIDISGGEPTIYPHIRELIRHCVHIGLKPTVITNTFELANKEVCQNFKDAGIDCFLVSIFGLNETAEKITGVKNAAQCQKKTLENLKKLSIPFRFNITMHSLTTPELPQLAYYAIESGALDVNFMIFNPFNEWRGKIDIDFQETYTHMQKPLREAISILESHGLEVNVRCFPLCLAQGFEKNVYNFLQLPYDHFEWNYNAWGNYFLPFPMRGWYHHEARRKAMYECGFAQPVPCQNCSLKKICNGIYKQYIERFGLTELVPLKLPRSINAPTFYISNQHRKSLEYTRPNRSIFWYIITDPCVLVEIMKGWKRFFMQTIEQNVSYRFFHSLYQKVKKTFRKVHTPKSLTIFVTNRCNLSCGHCFYRPHNKIIPQDMTVSLMCKVVKKIANCTHVILTGGEPFLHKDLVTICTLLQKRKRTLRICTNGTQFKMIQVALNSIAEMNFKKIIVQISFDGTQKVHEKLRGSGTFDQALHTLMYVHNMAKYESRLSVELAYTVTKENKNTVAAFLRMFIPFNVPMVIVPMRGRGSVTGVSNDVLRIYDTPEETLVPDVQDMKEVLNTIKILEEQLGRSILTAQHRALLNHTIQIMQEQKAPFPCVAGKEDGVIFENGDVSFCEMIQSVGNLLDYDGDFRALWTSRYANTQRKAINRCTCIHGCALCSSMSYEKDVEI